MDFREKVFNIKDQVLLQQAQSTGGAGGVTAALNKLMGKPTVAGEVLDLTSHAETQPPEMMADGWEWSLYPWLENNDSRYKLKTADFCTAEFRERPSTNKAA